MLNISLLALTLCGGVLVEPFRIAEAEPGHHQVCVRAAMAPDGHFAVVWVDSVVVDPGVDPHEIFIRFFDSDGTPLTDAYQITKMVDTNWIYWPCLEMDSSGNAVLVWDEVDEAQVGNNNDYVRFQRFAPDGSPAGFAQTLVPQVQLHGRRLIDLSLSNNDEFAVAWQGTDVVSGMWGIWTQRFNREGYPKNRAFLAHDDLSDTGDFFSFDYPQVALNDAGDLVVTWLDYGGSGKLYPRFQVFDAADESILPWEPMGHLVNEDRPIEDAGSRVEPYWLDNDRFVFFWIDHVWPCYLVGRVFADRGLTRYPIRRLVHDSLTTAWTDPAGQFAVAMSSDERFAETHTRTHNDPDDYWRLNWQHQGGVLGEIRDNEPWRRTTLFEYTPPWGKDTLGYDAAGGFPNIQTPAVGVCDDRIVWVYSRWNPDTTFETYVIISDWDMGIGVVEQPIVEKPADWEVITSIGSQIVLRYQDRPDGFRASIFDASGRKVDELHSTQPQGTIRWPVTPFCAGVYFIVLKSAVATKAQKVVLIR